MNNMCIYCGVVGRPFSITIKHKCDECADWDVFEAMLESWWYVHEQSRITSYHMSLCNWYQALDDEGVPLGYGKTQERWYAPYGGVTRPYENLTAKPHPAKVSRVAAFLAKRRQAK